MAVIAITVLTAVKTISRRIKAVTAAKIAMAEVAVGTVVVTMVEAMETAEVAVEDIVATPVLTAEVHIFYIYLYYKLS